MLDREIQITISGTQFTPVNSEDEPLSVNAIGSYYFKGGKHYIMYDEHVEGESMTTHNTLKIADDKVELVKKGAVNVKFEFEKGQKHLSTYILPFGSLFLGTITKELDIIVQDNRIETRIEYELEMDGEHASDCIIDIVVANKK